jgi:hypothetical protein
LANSIKEKIEVKMRKLKEKIVADTMQDLTSHAEYWKEVYINSRSIVRELCIANIPRLPSNSKKSEDWFEKNRIYLSSLCKKKMVAWAK